MASKLTSRLLVIPLALLRRLRRRMFDSRQTYRRILIAHHLLLGDTLLLTPLLAKLRRRYPDAELWMTVSPALAELYASRPYGVQVKPYHPSNISTLWSWLTLGEFDLAIVPGDNRYAWLARALGARCIVALAGDGQSWKDWQVDHEIPWPTHPQPLADIFSGLVDGADPPPYSVAQWPQTILDQSILPTGDAAYCVVHVSARNSLRRWPSTHWQQLATMLRQRGWRIVWSTGVGEEEILNSIQPKADDTTFPGTLNLAGLRQLLAGANLLITVETGIAHLCRTVGTPSVVIFGQGNPALHGTESFWQSASPMLAVFDANVPCRNQSHLFKRILPWVRRCDRTPDLCAKAVCMETLTSQQVIDAVDILVPDD